MKAICFIMIKKSFLGYLKETSNPHRVSNLLSTLRLTENLYMFQKQSASKALYSTV